MGLSPLAVLVVVAGSGAAAWAITTVIVAVMDLLGLVYSPAREAKRYAEPPTFTHVARRRNPDR